MFGLHTPPLENLYFSAPARKNRTSMLKHN